MEVAGWFDCNGRCGCGGWWLERVGADWVADRGVLLLLITPAGMVSGREGRANKVSAVVRDAGDGNGIFSGQDINENSQLNVYYIWVSSFLFSFSLALLLNDGIST